jgi:G3E family GTPase
MKLPLTVVSGYLGAGKTTLINRLLAEDHGLRLLVLVNDFGAINIDEALIAGRSDDMIALTNGCVCCTMGADLFMALGDALDREERPDHILVEASGIADPAAIANAAIAEPDLSYAGIITLVDALNAEALLADEMIAPQVAQQIKVADLLLVTKTDAIRDELAQALSAHSPRPPALVPETPLAHLLFDVVPLPRGKTAVRHPHYTAWSHTSDAALDRRTLGTLLENRPKGLYRLKGFVLTNDGAYELHIVGNYVDARRTQADRTQLVALGPADRLTPDDIETWWSASRIA